MNLQQLEYIIAVDQHRHFAKAAEKSCITQPTLSMMIQKLEQELGIRIFDRTKQPVIPTKEGAEIILRSRQIIGEVNRLKDYAKELKGEITGEIRLGIIPTLAPYLLPLFLKKFISSYPHLKIYIKEMITSDIMLQLQTGELDMALLATPLHDPLLEEQHLFYEEFFVYASQHEKLPKKKYLLPKEINPDHLLLLEEGHCMRNQVFNLCSLKNPESKTVNLFYEAGSIETLINLVDKDQGITIIPQMSTLHLTAKQQKNIRQFANPKPVREISIVTAKNYSRKKMLALMVSCIKEVIPDNLNIKNKKVLDF